MRSDTPPSPQFIHKTKKKKNQIKPFFLYLSIFHSFPGLHRRTAEFHLVSLFAFSSPPLVRTGTVRRETAGDPAFLFEFCFFPGWVGVAAVVWTPSSCSLDVGPGLNLYSEGVRGPRARKMAVSLCAVPSIIVV